MPWADPKKKAANKTARCRAKRSALVDLMGGHCRLCLFTGPKACFDIHHVDPESKSFGLEHNQFRRPWTELLEEADKCVLLCALCHRMLHAKA